MTLPYLYQPAGPGDGMLVARGTISMHKGTREAVMDAPTGASAVDLANAILAAGGVDGVVLSRHDVDRLAAERDAARTEAARVRLAWTSARRGRAQATAGVDYLLREVETAMSALHQALRKRDEARAERDAAAAQAAQSMRERAADAARSAVVVDRELSLTEQRAAIVAAIRGLGPLVSVVHADLPEAVTPCGLGTRDVKTTTTRVSEVTCLDCLRNLAAVRVGDELPAEDLVEPGDEVPALAELDGRLVDLENRLRPIEYTFGPEVWSDDAAPGGMVCSRASSTSSGGICGMPVESEPCPEHSLDGRLNAMQDQINAMLARVEDRLTPPTTQAAPAEVVRYRDRHGDVWERVDPFLYALVETDGDDTGGAIFARPLKYVRDTYGPLTPVTNAAAGPAPCEVCGRTPDAQEHGPDGRCRHTPATRLGHPKDNH